MASLSYTECEIDTGALESQAETFQELHAKISGRSGEFNTIAEPVATHFEGLVGEGLKSVAAENQEAWSSAMMACYHAYGMVQKVITDVEWYENRIEEIKADLATALGSSPSTGDEIEDASLRNAVVVRHNEMATEAWEDLEKRCETTEERLREGPTPENIHELVEAGHLGGNIAYYTTGNVEYFYFEESEAIAMADVIKTAIAGNGGAISDLDGQLALLNALILKSIRAQQNGEELRDNEIAFLDALFAELEVEENQAEQSRGDSTPQDFLAFINGLNESEDLSDEMKEDVNRHLSEAMLALSDENIGGGYDYLPDDVREAIEGPDLGDVDAPSQWLESENYAEWSEQFSQLSDFISSSTTGIQGGAEMGANIVGTSARMTEILGPSGEESPRDETYQDMLEVATRNPEVGHIVITGERFDGESYSYPGHISHMTPNDILVNLYSHDWSDDGKSISGISSWMEDYQRSHSPEEVELGNEVFAEFIDLITSPDMQESFNGTGLNVHEHNEDGDLVNTWRNVSIGHLNPDLADSFADLWVANMESFSRDEGLHSDNPPPAGTDGSEWLGEDGGLWLTPEARLAFTQYITGDPASAGRIYSEVTSYEMDSINGFFFDDKPQDFSGALDAGSLRGLVDTALANEVETRDLNNDEVLKYNEKVRNFAIDALGGLAGDMEVPAVFVEMGKFALKEELASPLTMDAESNASSPKGSWQASESIRRIALSALVEHHGEDAIDLIAKSEGAGVLTEEENGDYYIPQDWTAWDVSSEERTAALANAFSSVSQLGLPNSNNPVMDDYVAYLDLYSGNREKWEVFSENHR